MKFVRLFLSARFNMGPVIAGVQGSSERFSHTWRSKSSVDSFEALYQVPGCFDKLSAPPGDQPPVRTGPPPWQSHAEKGGA